MEFPKMLYKLGGSEEIHGERFSTLIVADDAEQETAFADGWKQTTTEAKKPVIESKTYSDGTTATGVAPLPDLSPDQQADSAPPTREELERKAAELGLKFDGRTSDKKLGEMIAAALK